MGTIDARGACHGADGRYATASTCRGSGLSEDGAVLLGVLGGAAIVGLVVWLATRSSGAPSTPAGAPAEPIGRDRERLGPRAEADEEARLRGAPVVRRCQDGNGNAVVIRGLCASRGLRDVE